MAALTSLNLLNKFHFCSSKKLELSALLKSVQLNLNLYIHIYINIWSSVVDPLVQHAKKLH